MSKTVKHPRYVLIPAKIRNARRLVSQRRTTTCRPITCSTYTLVPSMTLLFTILLFTITFVASCQAILNSKILVFSSTIRRPTRDLSTPSQICQIQGLSKKFKHGHATPVANQKIENSKLKSNQGLANCNLSNPSLATCRRSKRSELGRMSPPRMTVQL